MRISILSILALLCTAVSLSAQEPIEVKIPDTTAERGQNICLPLTVREFNNVAFFTFPLLWNPRVVEFDTIIFQNPALEMGGGNLSVNTDFKEEGVLIFYWLSGVDAPINIPDDSTLVELCFNAIGSINDTTDIIIRPYQGTDIDFADTSASRVVEISDGSVAISLNGNLDFNYTACESSSGIDMNVQIFGGRRPYSFNLTGAGTANTTGQNDQFDIPGLSIGNYTLEITDADGQTVTRDISLRNPGSTPGASTVNNTCSSENPNGMIYLTTPLAASHHIEWTYNNQTYYNVDTLKNLSGGEVMLSVVDSNNCRIPPRTFTIEDLGIRATPTVTLEPNCNGNPGDVLIEISGGTPDYTVNYNGDNLTTNTSSITMDIYGTTATYRIWDANNCAINLPVTTTLTSGEVFTLNSGTVTDINCENMDEATGGRRGQFVGNVTNGSTTSNNFNSAELFHSDGTPVNGTKFITNPLTGSLMARFLDPGTYEWRISGECAGSDTTFAFTIEDLTLTPPSIDPTISPIGCDSSNALGAISLTVFPENRGYSYIWSTGDTTSSISNVDTGRYSVIVTDTLSKCSRREDFTIQPGVVLSKIESTLPCDADTMINVGVTIRDDYQAIRWDSGENTEIIQVNTPGYYPFTITPEDAACSPYRDSIYIASQTGGISITGLNPVLVNSCSNPEAIMVAYTSQPTDSLGFSWDDGPVTMGLNDYRFYDDEMHNLKVYKDDCVAIDTNFSFTFNNIIKIDTTVHNIDCNGNDNGEITVLASGGGSNNFRYEFNNSGRQDFFASYTDLTPGNYTVKVIDQTPPSASPCPDVNLPFTITEPEPFTVAVDTSQITQPSCYGDSDGMIMLTTSGGNPGTKDIRYNYSGGADQTNELTLDSLRASNYQIRVEDSLGCVATTQYLLEDPEPVNFTIPPIAEPACAGYTTTVTIPNATGGTGMNYQYSVDGGVPVPLGEPLDILAGTHEITVFDGNLCTVTNDITIREPAPIVVDFNQPDTIQVSLGEGTDIAAQINGENPITDYIWTPAPADSLSEDNTLSFTAVDNVTVGLEVLDSRGCVGSNEIFVLVRKKRDVGIPNAFTPNGDGHNDLLTIVPGPAVRSIKNFQIYDRWGNLLWEESDISPAQAQITGWDGTSSGSPAMFDVYVALVKVEYIDGEVIQRITDVTLLK